MDTKDTNLEEMSAVAAVQGAAVVDKEELEETEEKNIKRLRLVIREAIKLYASKNANLSANVNNEEKLRQVIRSLILQEAESSQPPPDSTLNGLLDDYLNDTLKQVKRYFTTLQSDKDEQQGFISRFMNGIHDIISLPEFELEDESEQKELTEVEDEEEENPDDDVKFTFGASANASDGEPEQKEEEPEPEQEEPVEKPEKQFFDRGEDFASKALRDILTRTKEFASDLVGEERESGKEAVLRNMGAWLIIWSGHDSFVYQAIVDTLGNLNITLPQKLDSIQDPEAEQPTEQTADTETITQGF